MSFSLFFGDGAASTLDGRYFCGPTSEARQASALLQVEGPVLLVKGDSKNATFHYRVSFSGDSKYATLFSVAAACVEDALAKKGSKCRNSFLAQP